MGNLHITRRQILKGAGAVGVLGAVGVPIEAFAEEDEGRRVRWDIVSLFTTTPACVSPGGKASARSVDGSEITLTGSGTFPDVHNRCANNVMGGGTWMITPGTAPGCFTGHGTYKVTELLSWAPTPGKVSLTGLRDCIPGVEPENSTSGLAELRVRYTNANTGAHTNGVLTVSCDLPPAPHCIFEGITASMEWEDFLHAEPPVDDRNRTVFHFLEGGED